MLKKLLDECILLLNSIGYYPQITDIRLNNRLSRTYGWYNEDEKTIEINKKVYDNASEEQIKNLIIHELSHNIDHLLNGKTSDDLQGHGSSWQVIADTISEKLGIKVQRYSTFTVPQQITSKFNHTYRCKGCGYDKTVQSKYSDAAKVRTGKCICCNGKDFEYLFPGQYGYDFKTMKRIIILDTVRGE